MDNKGISTALVAVIAIVVTAIVVGSVVYVATPKKVAKPGKEPITVYSVLTGEEAAKFKSIFADFAAKTGIPVKHVGVDTETLRTTTLADYEAGRTPGDVIVMPWPARICSDAKAGHLIPVGETWDPGKHGVSADAVTYGGEIYASPWKLDIKPGFWYRKSFFDEHNLSEPGTYDEFLSLLDKISGISGVEAPLACGGTDGWTLSDVTEAFILRQGADVQLGLISGDVTFSDSRVKAALGEVLDLLKAGYFGTPRKFGIAYHYMWNESTPLYFMGSWTPAFIKGMGEDPAAVDFFSLPGVKGAVGSSNWMTIPKYSDRQEDAKKLLEYFAGVEAQTTYAGLGGFIATNKDVPADAYKLSVMKKISDVASRVEVVDDLDDALGDPFQSTFWDQLQLLWAEPSQGTLDSVIEELNAAQAETLG